MENPNDQKIVFPGNGDEVIIDILKKHGLEETEKELSEKLLLENSSPLRGTVILDLAIAVAKGNMRTEDLAPALQNELSIKKEVADQIAKDMEENLIKYLKVVPRQEWEKGRAKDTNLEPIQEPDNQTSRNITFSSPSGSTEDSVVDEIIKRNYLQEDPQDFLEKFFQDEEPIALIIQEAAVSLAEKKIPEKRLAELLQKHLEVSQKTAENIVSDIQQKLVPFIRIETPKTSNTKSSYRQELLKRVQKNISEQSEEIPPTVSIKKPEVSDVDKNAEK